MLSGRLRQKLDLVLGPPVGLCLDLILEVSALALVTPQLNRDYFEPPESCVSV